MNPIFQTVIMNVLRLKRTCPKCGKGQVVPANKRSKHAYCKYCGADMPPCK